MCIAMHTLKYPTDHHSTSHHWCLPNASVLSHMCLTWSTASRSPNLTLRQELIATLSRSLEALAAAEPGHLGADGFKVGGRGVDLRCGCMRA